MVELRTFTVINWPTGSHINIFFFQMATNCKGSTYTVRTDPYQYPLFGVTDPHIRIRKKYLRIRNTDQEESWLKAFLHTVLIDIMQLLIQWVYLRANFSISMPHKPN